MSGSGYPALSDISAELNDGHGRGAGVLVTGRRRPKPGKKNEAQEELRDMPRGERLLS
jgi:hypothetical protein